MYESFYKLTSKPFRLSPDPSFFYPSSGHKRALSYLLYGLNQAEGFVVITGAPGTGKTTLAHKLLSQIDPTTILVAHLSSTQIEADDLLRLVAASFRLRSENLSKAALLRDLESFLLARARERKRCLLVVDEAQNLPEASIEELRMLSNFQVGHNALLQVFMLGQEQFRTMLDSPSLEQLKQRVIANFHLNPLTPSETRSYIESRLSQSGWKGDPSISADAFAAIHEYTGGLPRRINMFCDRLLLFGYLEGMHELTGMSVAAVIEELKSDTAARNHNKVVFAPVDRMQENTGAVVQHQVIESRAVSTADGHGAPRPSEVSAKRVPEARDELAARPAPAPAPAAEPGAPMGPDNAATPAPPASSAPADPPVAAESRTSPSTASGPAMTAPQALTSTLDRTISDLSSYLRVDKSPSEITIDVPVTSVPEERTAAPAPETGTGVRWLNLLAGVAVLAIIAYWFYPYVAGEGDPEPIGSRRPLHAQDPAKRTPDPVAASDPAVMPNTAASPAESAMPQHEPAVALDEPQAPSGNALPGTTDTAPRSTSPPAPSPMTSSLPATAPPAAEPELIEPPKPKARPEKRTPRSEPRREAAAVPLTRPAPLATPEPTPAAAAPVTAEPAAAMPAAESAQPAVVPAQADAPVGAAAAPPEPAETSAPEPISQRELALLLMNFARAYEEGNLERFSRLFDAGVRTEDRTSLAGLRADYNELFLKTVSRQIILGDVRWTLAGTTARGIGPFEVRVRGPNEERPRIFRGSIEFQVERKGADALIVGLFHRSH